jgi:hypothetical protein
MAFPMLMLAAAGVQAGGSVLGGIGAKQSADLNAFSTKTESIMMQVEASQRAAARMEEYKLASATNTATFAAQGRDISADQSVRAFMERQREIVNQDTSRMATQSNTQRIQMAQKAAAIRSEGRSAMASSLISATSGLLSAGYKYSQVKT